MKPVTRIKRMIQKELSSEETYELSEYARQLSYEKKKQEHRAEIEAIGVGNAVLVAGGSSEMARLEIGAKVGIIQKYNLKRVRLLIKDCNRPGEWRIPYHYLYPATEENIKRETKLLEHAKMTLPIIKQMNKIFTNVM